MCGRAYSTYTDDEIYFLYLNRKPVTGADLPFKPNYNMSPTHEVPVMRIAEGSRALDTMRWGLIPEWSPEFSTKLSTINAKSETVFESRLYKKAITQRRAIVPLSGFFEWKKDGTAKRPFKIFLKDSPIMSVAGIWTAWRAGTPGEQRSFSILTTSANDFMSKIHDRMPVILNREQWDEWLDPEVHEVDQINALMKPCPPECLDCVEVSPLVNSPRNNRVEVLQPLNS
jgi:putative SOS response-associated peptidase YedK